MDVYQAERSLMDVTLVALFNLVNIGVNEAPVINITALKLTIQVMKVCEYDADVLFKGLKIVAALTPNECCLVVLNERDGIAFLMNIISQHICSGKLVQLACLCISNALVSEQVQAVFQRRHLEYGRTLLACMDLHRQNIRTIKYILVSFALMARSGIAMDLMSREGLHAFIRVSQPFLHDQETVSYLIEIIGQVSISGRYTADIVQTGCVKLLLHILNVYTQTHALVLGVLRSILIIMGISNECKLILSEAGGEAAVDHAINLHSERDVRKVGGKILRRLRDEESLDSLRLSFVTRRGQNKNHEISELSDAQLNRLERGASRRRTIWTEASDERRTSFLIPV